MAGNFIAGAIKRPGALTRKAEEAGETTHEFAEAHEHAPGLTGEESRFAMLLGRVRPKGKVRARVGKPRRAAPSPFGMPGHGAY